MRFMMLMIPNVRDEAELVLDGAAACAWAWGAPEGPV
jgi:hypothetical protein